MTKTTLFKTNLNPDVRLLHDLYGRRCIYVHFKGYLTVEIAEEIVSESVRLAKEDSDEKITVVWNCLEMENYEAKAREVCEKGITENAHLMDRIYVLTTSIVIQAAAEIIKFFTPLPFKALSSFERLENEFKSIEN